MPFELHGRDEENVPVFTGAPEGHSTGAWLFSLSLGALIVAGFVLTGFHALAVQHSILRFALALSVGALLTGSVVIGSVWWYRLTREIPHLASLEELGNRFGVGVDGLREHARTTGIRPRLRVNGKGMYRPRDFGDPAHLLRAAGGPGSNPNSMLRTSQARVDEAALPRPAANPESVVIAQELNLSDRTDRSDQSDCELR